MYIIRKALLWPMGILASLILSSCQTYHEQVLYKTLDEVLQKKKVVGQMSTEEGYLVLQLSENFQVRNLKTYKGQKILLGSQKQIEELTLRQNKQLNFLYIQLDKADDGKAVVTASYSCNTIGRQNDTVYVSRDLFCLGGIVIDYTKKGIRLRKKIEYSI